MASNSKLEPTKNIHNPKRRIPSFPTLKRTHINKYMLKKIMTAHKLFS